MKNNPYLIPAVYVLLTAVGIPWYLPPDITTIIYGFPLWAFISLLTALIGALFTAWLYLFEFSDDDT